MAKPPKGLHKTPTKVNRIKCVIIDGFGPTRPFLFCRGETIHLMCIWILKSCLCQVQSSMCLYANQSLAHIRILSHSLVIGRYNGNIVTAVVITYMYVYCIHIYADTPCLRYNPIGSRGFHPNFMALPQIQRQPETDKYTDYPNFTKSIQPYKVKGGWPMRYNHHW